MILTISQRIRQEPAAPDYVPGVHLACVPPMVSTALFRRAVGRLSPRSTETRTTLIGDASIRAARAHRSARGGPTKLFEGQTKSRATGTAKQR